MAQVDLLEFDTNLVYIVSSKAAKPTYWDTVHLQTHQYMEISWRWMIRRETNEFE